MRLTRRSLLLAAAAGALSLSSACSSDTAAPAPAEELSTVFGTDLAVLGSFGADAWAAGAGADGIGGAGHVGWLLRALPPDLKLTDAQIAQIRSLVEAFQAATRADREALAAIRKQAEAAHRAGATRAEVEAILATGKPIKERLAAAEARLANAINGVLTDAQRRWLATHTPVRCHADGIALTEEQKAQIAALISAFETANRADLDAVKAAMDAAAAARKAGKSREEIHRILSAVRPAMQRIEAARAELHRQIQALLTPAQKASGCFLGGPKPAGRP